MWKWSERWYLNPLRVSLRKYLCAYFISDHVRWLCIRFEETAVLYLFLRVLPFLEPSIFSDSLNYTCTGFKQFSHQADCFNVQSSRLDGNWCNFTFSPVFSWFCCFLPAKFIVFFSLLVTRASRLMFRLLSWCMNAVVILLNVRLCELGMSTHVALHCGITIQYICA